MNLFHKRPLALFCALFAAASVLGAWLTAKDLSWHLPIALVSLLSSALLLAVPIFMHRFHPRLLTPILALLFVAFSLLESWASIDRKLEKIDSLGGDTQSCTLRIEEKSVSQNYLSTYLVEVESLGDLPIKASGRITFPFYTNLAVGDTVTGEFVAHTATSDPQSASYLLSRGILIELEAETEDFSVIDHTKPDPLTTSLFSLRHSLSEFIGEHVSGEEGHLISSLFLNKRELLEDRTVRDFRRTGTTHLLAISGMHLSVIILLADFLLRSLGVSKNRRCVAILLLTLFYLTLTGFALSACRAFLMCCFVYLSWLFQSDNDTVTSLFFALFFILLISPTSVYDIGMWMSVLAVLGILVALNFLEAWKEKLRRKGWATKRLRRLFRPISAVCISLAAELFILLPMWLAFDELSLVALPCGLFLSPLVTLVLFLTPFLVFFAWLPAVASLLGHILFGISHVILEGVTLLSRFRGITVSLGYDFFAFVIPLFSLITLLLLILKLRRKWLVPTTMGIALLSIALFLCFLRIPATNTVMADYLGKKDNALLGFTTGEATVICDITSGSYSTIEEARTLLTERRATEILAYVLTHYHKLHVSSLTRLFGNTVVRALYLPLPKNDDEQSTFWSLLALAQEQDCPVMIYDRGSPLSFGELSLTVSDEVYLKRSSHPTFYVSATAFDGTVIYVGESLHEDKALYEELCQKTESAELLLLGTHGPITKTSFCYPIGEGNTILTDPLLLEHFALENPPHGKFLCETTRFSLPLCANKNES